LNQALCLASGTPDRTSALTRATERFEELSLLTDPIDWPSRVGQIRCYRVAEQHDALQRALKRYLSDAPPSVVVLLKQELARWHLARGDIEAALEILQQRPAMTPSTAAEWDFVLLEVLLAGWRQQAGDPAADAWQQRVTQQVQHIQANHGPFWLRRAEAMLGRRIAASPDVDEFALLIRAAEAYFRAGQIEEALAAYDRAGQAAVESSADEQAFQTGFTAAAIVHQRKMHAAARQRFAALSLQFPNHPRAAEAHWLAVFNQSQRIKEGASEEAKRYTDMLSEHVQRWPRSDTAGKAWWWLGQYHEACRHWEEAIAAYRNIASVDARFTAGLAAMARCYQRWLDELGVQDRAAQRRRALEAVRYFDGVGGSLQVARTPVTDLATVEAAGLRVYGLGGEFARAERQLRRVLADAKTPPPAWLPRARLYLVYALAAQGKKLDEAHQQLPQSAAATAQDLNGLVDALAGLVRDRRSAGRQAVAELQLEVLKLQEGLADQQSAARLKSSAVARAEALAAAGRRDAALKASAALAEQYADDGLLQERYAQLLLAGSDRADWQAALLRWREVQRHSRPGSPRWFRAKYAQALAHHRLGNSAQAVRIIKLTEVLHPELGGPEMKTSFVELLQRCQMAR
jgi:tetratricopeptide (TPR) repeat protein